MAVPKFGDVWHYDYLWSWQNERGETEGRKPRPISFVAVIEDAKGVHNLFMLAITSRPPLPNQTAIEIPLVEKRKAGLDDISLWVIVDEYNHDVLETSFYFNTNRKIGSFSSSFADYILEIFQKTLVAKKAKRIVRMDEQAKPRVGLISTETPVLRKK